MIDLPFIAVNSGTGGGSTGGVEITHVEYYANLPAANLNSGKYYFVDKETIWNKLNPLAKTQGGLYRSDGTTWLAGIVPELAGVSDGTNILVDYPVVFSGVTVDNTANTVTINSQTENNFTTALKNLYDGYASTIASKLDAAGHILTDNNFTTTLLSKLNGIENSANNYTHPANHSPSIITQDANNRFVSDTEKGTWNNKQNALTAGVDYASLSMPNQMTHITAVVGSNSLSAGVATKLVNWSTPPVDTLKEVSVADSKIIIANTGTYEIIAKEVFTTACTANPTIKVNGSTLSGPTAGVIAGGLALNIVKTGFNAGDCIELYATSSVANTLSVASLYITRVL